MRLPALPTLLTAYPSPTQPPRALLLQRVPVSSFASTATASSHQTTALSPLPLLSSAPPAASGATAARRSRSTTGRRGPAVR